MKQQSASTVTKRPPRRKFRLWEKKRGGRQTGSTQWGRAAEVGFFAALFLLGVFSLSEVATLWWVAHDQSFITSDLGLWLSTVVLGMLILSSAGGAIYSAILTATSAERRAAIAQRATRRDLLDDLQSDRYPAIPDDTHWKISPGVRLAYRLPSSSTTGVRLGVTAVYTLVWNAAVIILTVFEFNLGGQKSGQVIRQFLSRPWINLTGVVLAVFAGFGGYLIYRLIGQLTAAEAMGPTYVELSAQPVRPGGLYRMLVIQHGHLQIRSFEMRLVCDEEVTYSEGTDTRTESRRVYDEQVCQVCDVEIRPSEPFHHETELRVPDDAMHSFVSGHNSIAWKLVVQAKSKKWPQLHRVFPLIMYPAESVSSETKATVPE